MSQTSFQFPMVSVIVPVYNEEAFIVRCIRSLLNQDYPQNRMEIMIMDGNSVDGTCELVKDLMKTDSRIRLISNPRRIIPAAVNLGIVHAAGDVIVRADAHTVYDRGYLRQSVTLLLTSGAANVGGVIYPKGQGMIGTAVALAVSSPFGVGNAYYRFSRREMCVDTVPFGCWLKKTLLDLGGYDESYLINEDYELNYRIRKNGGKILLSPKIKSTYYPRDSFKHLAAQYLRYGKWKVKTLVEHPESLVYRQAVAPLFVLALCAAAIMFPYTSGPLWAVTIPYLAASLAVSGIIASKHGSRYFPVIPIAFFIIHISWGLGFFSGMKSFGIPALTRPHKPSESTA